MDFVDEQDRAGIVLQLGDDRLEPFLEIAAIAGAGQQCAHVERENGRFGQNLRHVALDDALGQAFGDGGFADARLAHIERIVFGATTQNLNGALDFLLAADQRIDFSRHRLFVEIDAVIRERVLVAPSGFLVTLLLVVLILLSGALHRTLGGAARRLGDAVADEVDGIEPGHVLQLQKIDGVAFAFGEQSDKDVGAGDFIAAGGLHVDRRALHDALEPGGGLGVAGAVGRQAGQILVEEFAEIAAQLVEIDAAGAQHGGRVAVVGKAQQQMFQGRVFVTTLAGQGQGAVQRLFEVTGKHGRRS